MMGALKGEFFPSHLLNKNSLSLAHCALNRSCTVYLSVSFLNFPKKLDFLHNSRSGVLLYQ